MRSIQGDSVVSEVNPKFFSLLDIPYERKTLYRIFKQFAGGTSDRMLLLTDASIE